MRIITGDGIVVPHVAIVNQIGTTDRGFGFYVTMIGNGHILVERDENAGAAEARNNLLDDIKAYWSSLEPSKWVGGPR